MVYWGIEPGATKWKDCRRRQIHWAMELFSRRKWKLVSAQVVKCLWNAKIIPRDCVWRTATKFVLQLGRYELSSPVSCHAPRLSYGAPQKKYFFCSYLRLLYYFTPHDLTFKFLHSEELRILFRILNSSPLLTFKIFVETKQTRGRKSWSSGNGRRLMFWRSWVRIPAPYTR